MNRQNRDESVEEALHLRIPRWPAVVALLIITAAYSVVSETLTLVPRVGLSALVVVGLLLLFLARLRGHRRLVRTISFILIGAVTLAEVVSALLLVSILPRGEIAPTALLRDAAIIWGINVLTFALWYWEIDGGGPVMRRLKTYEGTDFLFPQRASGENEHWSPDFLDYLFVAFNHSTAFSPTDTAVLSRRAKTLVMIQATLSLMVIAVLASKAINAL
jgi:hypothetical protein